ncbi:hypothetical protein C8N46_106128 [Kordia periserrulae]|uniref:Uncharacterized protein n=1 Tax=Kordia periserrulae TaxID=701523 RepID=A0A2T6BWM5_9FLAO|nr:hypothetical protein [Kordia periserrulae]PTX60484.1 hypothetical protein C8N46_106128 [Kordia periserrulae]
MKKYIIIILIFGVVISCVATKDAEQTRLKDIKAVLKLHLDTQFTLNSKRRTWYKKDFIYFQIHPREEFNLSIKNKLESQNPGADKEIFGQFFDDDALAYYKQQKFQVHIELLEKELISEKFKSKRERDAKKSRLVQLYDHHTYHAALPVFTKDGKYALVPSNSEGGAGFINIYKKENNVWKIYGALLRWI